jgi:type IV secretory pathway TrbL component
MGNLALFFTAGQPTSRAKEESPLYMRTKLQLSTFLLGTALVFGPALGWSQPSSPSQDTGAKQDMKDAGHETKDAAKDAGHSVKQGTKKAYHKTKHGTKKAWHKTKDTTTGAVDGAKEGAKKPE